MLMQAYTAAMNGAPRRGMGNELEDERRPIEGLLRGGRRNVMRAHLWSYVVPYGMGNAL